MRRTCWIILSLLLIATPESLARSDARVDIDVTQDVDLSIAARARMRPEDHIAFAWDWGDGETSFGAKARHAYRAPGAYRVVVTMTDDAGETWSRVHEVEVNAPATGVDVGIDGDHVETRAGVDARTRVEWDWGDGETSRGRRASHRYGEAGTYELVVTFQRGDACWTQSRTIVVAAGSGGRSGESDPRGEDDRSSHHRAEVRASLPGASARVSWGHEHEDDREARSSWRSESSVRVSSFERHDAPGPGGAALVATAACVAIAARFFRRR